MESQVAEVRAEKLEARAEEVLGGLNAQRSSWVEKKVIMTRDDEPEEMPPKPKKPRAVRTKEAVGMAFDNDGRLIAVVESHRTREELKGKKYEWEISERLSCAIRPIILSVEFRELFSVNHKSKTVSSAALGKRLGSSVGVFMHGLS